MVGFTLCHNMSKLVEGSVLEIVGFGIEGHYLILPASHLQQAIKLYLEFLTLEESMVIIKFYPCGYFTHKNTQPKVVQYHKGYDSNPLDNGAFHKVAIIKYKANRRQNEGQHNKAIHKHGRTA